MTKKLSIVVSGLLLSTTMAFSADSIDNAFKEGKVSGSLMGYSKVTENSDTLTTGTVGLGYETASYMGLTGKVGFFAGHEVEGAATNTFTKNSLMTEANLTYTADGFALIAGRQAIDLEWMGDYHESVVAAITAIPDTTIVLGYTDKKASADEDEIVTFTKFNGSKGAYVADIKFTGINGLELNPYYYDVVDVKNTYGLKATYSSDMFGAVAHYAAADVDANSEDDTILHLEASTVVAGISLAAGYVTTDKTAGADDLGAGDDNINPFDDGSSVYSADADTYYTSAGYTISGVTLGALYGETKVGSQKDKELNLTADYSLTDSLTTSLLYVDSDGDMTDTTYGSVLVTYSF